MAQLCLGPRIDSFDLRQNLEQIPYDNIPQKYLHTDIRRLREGRCGWQFWSVYSSGRETGAKAIQQTLEQIDIIHRLAAKYNDVFELASTSNDVERVFRSGKIASMMGIEGHQNFCAIKLLLPLKFR